MAQLDPTQRLAPDTALLPRQLRRAVMALVAVLLAGATYLMLVRGPALLFDLARGAMAYCF
jgi:hypothetical protein